jgi:hypothetical protein
VEGSCEHGNEPSGSIKTGNFLSGYTIGGFSRRAQLHGVSCDDDDYVVDANNNNNK